MEYIDFVLWWTGLVVYIVSGLAALSFGSLFVLIKVLDHLSIWGDFYRFIAEKYRRKRTPG